MKQSLLIATGLTLALAFSPVYASDLSKATNFYEQQDYEKARVLLEPLARDGDLKALNLLGKIYENGLGVSVNRKRAEGMYERGANVGDIDSLNNLRELKNQDYREELKTVLPRIDNGYASAMNRYGVMLEFGQGVTRNPTQAFEWYSKAANANFPEALYNLGRAYNFGTGVEQNFAEAERWYRKAVAAGNTDAIFFLGTLYSNNLGSDKAVDQNVIAYAWMHNSANLGNSAAQTIEKRLLMKLETANLTNEAKALATAYELQYLR